MSAFICCDEHISAIVGWYVTKGQEVNYENRQKTREQMQELGQILLDENIRSVNHRYNENEPTEAFTLLDTFVSYPLSPIDIIKACNCLDYQSCETPDYEQTLAHKLLGEIISAACRALPGYELAAWEITSHPETRQSAVS